MVLFVPQAHEYELAVFAGTVIATISSRRKLRKANSAIALAHSVAKPSPQCSAASCHAIPMIGVKWASNYPCLDQRSRGGADESVTVGITLTGSIARVSRSALSARLLGKHCIRFEIKDNDRASSSICDETTTYGRHECNTMCALLAQNVSDHFSCLAIDHHRMCSSGDV